MYLCSLKTTPTCFQALHSPPEHVHAHVHADTLCFDHAGVSACKRLILRQSDHTEEVCPVTENIARAEWKLHFAGG